VRNPDTRAFQSRLEGERATDHEGDEIVSPLACQITGRTDQLAVAKNSVAWHVRADIDVRTEGWQAGISGLPDSQQRARFGIEDTKAQEIPGQGFRKNRQISLKISGRLTARRTFERTGPNPFAQNARGSFELSGHFLCSLPS